MKKMSMNTFIGKRAVLAIAALALQIIGTAGAALAMNPEVKLADGPLFSGQGNVHPNLLLSLSVEFPTVGIAYSGKTYIRTDEYVGYFNPSKCYTYKGGNRNLTDEEGYFVISKVADPATHECDGGDSFSGNFMNWASASAIDMLRYALTGGDRVFDSSREPGKTILQRAVLPNTLDVNFYAHPTYFPRRSISASDTTSAPNRVTPFNVSTLYIVSCANRILFSDSNSGVTGKDADKARKYCSAVYDAGNPGKTETTDKKLGEYLVRVQVCDSDDAASRPSLCRSYGGHYKPVGAIQQNADQLRVAAMGYLLDDSEQRYGGVLRAPMKYVGPKEYKAPDFVAKDNERREWDPDTGVFIENPEQDQSVGRSGVINYLNQFGRSGIYKRYDPVSELYYEGIRYLQGKTPTPDATANMTDAMRDGFPAITDWADPVVASCQRNYIVSIADVNTHWDRYIPGNERTTYGSGVDAHDKVRAVDAEVNGVRLDVRPWTREVGEKEVGRNPDLANLDTKDTGSAGHGTYYMAGLAYWASTHDIRQDKKIRVKTFTIDVDEGGNGLIDGNPRAIAPRDSQLYLAAKYGGQAGSADCPGGDTPSNYFLASQPKEMIRSIRTVFDSVGSASGTIAGVSVTSTKISSDGAFVFQPGFDPSNWCGNLRKRALKLNEDDTLAIANTPEWDAGQILTGRDRIAGKPGPADRKIYTSGMEGGKFISPVAFKWTDEPNGKDGLSKTQQTLLDASPVSGQADGLGRQRLEYLRGERSLELGRSGGIFRPRGSLLGDIVNSNPVYVGPPATGVLDDGYAQFRENNKGRAKAVYVGANDGMLHAFSADDGSELFAYVPNALLPKLGQLTRPDYVHRPYVDGMSSVSEARLGTGWKTILVAGMGGGAQGVFALDVTNPLDFAGGSGALFEFTEADDPDMGNVVGAPAVAKFRIGIDKNGMPAYRYFAVVPSGLNNYKDDGRSNPKAVGALFLLSLEKSPAQAWTEGVNYYKLTTPNTDASVQNGLSSPALVVGANGVVRYAYAGDLQGNLWRFDFTGMKSWSEERPRAVLLFTAKDADGVRQPISTQPKVVFAPGGGYVVLFGTGKFLEKDDTVRGYFKPQSFYGILDTLAGGYMVNSRAQLTKRVLGEPDKNGSLQVSGEPVAYGESRGWYFDFFNSANTGERSVSNGLVTNGALYFNTLMPSSDPCTAGSGRTYVLNTLTGMPSTGTRTGLLSTVGMLSSPIVFNTHAAVSERNAIGRRQVRKKSVVFNFGTDGAAPVASGEAAVPAGRFSWREIVNWLDR